MNLNFRTTCRACGSSSLTKVIDIGEQYLQGLFIKPGKPLPPSEKYPTSLVWCDKTKNAQGCGLLQMSCTVPPKVLYTTYWYRSGINQTMRDHLRGIAKEAMDMVEKTAARVLDIGCNDGTLLRYFPKESKKFGIDPSDVARDLDGEIAVINDIFPSEELNKKTHGEPFDIIASIAMFYDLENPIDFVRNVKQHLSDQGLWIFEMSYMPTMLKMNAYDTICHEHLEYYSLAVIEYILKKAEMKLIKVSLNDINGGSIRCFATHIDNPEFRKFEHSQFIRELLQAESDLGLHTEKPYREFQVRIDAHKEELSSLLNNLKREGKRIHVYGASTKGNTILQLCGIDNSIIDYAADRSPDKHGARTLGTNIPIISEAESRAIRPDYYLVLPWHFRKEFLERERESLEQGVGMIFPLPVVEIIKHK